MTDAYVRADNINYWRNYECLAVNNTVLKMQSVIFLKNEGYLFILGE